MILAVVLAVLAGRNVAGNLLPPAAYVPVNLAVAGVVLVLARAGDVSWHDLGLSGSRLGHGAALGGAVFAVVTVVLVVGAVVPATRPFFDDERVAGVQGLEVLYQAVVRIPLGTVVLEELAFRGVLLALLRRDVSTAAAVAWSSAAFGLWHIVPTIDALRANDLAVGVPAVAGAVVVTAVAGVLFCVLRLRSGSLLAPALAHVATNSVALVVATTVRSP